MTPIDTTDARILDLIQRKFPLNYRPFDVIAELLSIEPEDALARIRRLKTDGIIRQISAIFDSRALGYQSLLVAFKVTGDKLENVAAEVSKHPGISHCYSRDADYNLWFTIALPPESDLEHEVDKLSLLSGVLTHMLLPALNVFKIGVYLAMSGEWKVESRERVEYGEQRVQSPEFREAVRALQTDLPLVEEPFSYLADQKGMSEDRLIAYAKEFLHNGVMRRYSAVLNHRRVGYTHNAMLCWKVPADMIEIIGNKLAEHPAVSHCYQRPTYSDWPYSLYTMIHARSKSELDKIISYLAQVSMNSEYLALNTVAEFKKTRVLYFE